ncbi:hypothetical protein Patl1_02606 [Pistacia atlantica]|uniref:Uncharacterized protein n=1 Tax=Pistacia atlantica TaxID=434234 RepID=A0ACC1C6W6_9ROSI|nr:hypothetical protein Patl1_02606 [Pistacia atlantica]
MSSTQWSKNKLQVIVGTVAFGMGINKPDVDENIKALYENGVVHRITSFLLVVRFVIHHSLSKSVETYYQESGRAGRDGLPSECLLFFRPADVPRQSSMVFYENSGLQNLYDIVRYCQSKKQCRRSTFFRHFAEPLRDCNGMCDNCAFSSEVKEVDVSRHAKFMVSLLQDMKENDQRLTLLQLVDKMKTKHKELGSDLKKEEMEQLVLKLIVDRVLVRIRPFRPGIFSYELACARLLVWNEEFQHTAYSTNAYVTVGPLAKQVLLGKKIIKLEISGGQKNTNGGKKSTKRSFSSSALELKLDEIRKELSAADGGILPHSLDKIIGKLKTDKYGTRILEEINKCANAEQPDASASKEGQTSETRAKKRLKTEKALVVVESSDDEEV